MSNRMDSDPPVPANITYNQQNGTYSMNPQNPQVKKKDSINFNASNQSCTIRFNPTNTPFTDHLDIDSGQSKNVEVGDSDYTVTYCITTKGGSCTPPSRFADDNTGTIKVGSGTGMGDGHGHSKH